MDDKRAREEAEDEKGEEKIRERRAVAIELAKLESVMPEILSIADAFRRKEITRAEADRLTMEVIKWKKRQERERQRRSPNASA